MRLSAIDALQRGLLNLRANPKLLLWQVVQGLLVTIIAIVGMAPVVLALGAGGARAIWSAGRAGWSPGQTAEIEQLLERALEQWPLLAAAVAAATAVWTVAFLIYCWMQAGVMGQLAAGDKRAGDLTQPAVADFKVYSWPDFTRAATARVWKFFWLINLLALVGLVFVFVSVLVAGLGLTVAGSKASPLAALALGCVLMLVLLVVFFFLFAWTGVAKAEMVVAESGVMRTFKSSFALLGRRLGAVLLLLILFVVGSVAVGVVFVPVSLFFDVAIGDSITRQVAADVALAVIQTPFNAALIVTLSAALVALVRGER